MDLNAYMCHDCVTYIEVFKMIRMMRKTLKKIVVDVKTLMEYNTIM